MSIEAGEQRAEWKWPLAVFALAVVVYLPILKNGFVFDDYGLIVQNIYIRDLSHLSKFFTTDLWSFYDPGYEMQRIHYWRPLLLTSWALLYRFFGLHPAAFHFLSILVHALCTGLLFVLGKQLGERKDAAAAAAAIFALHPVHVDAVAWASGLSDLLVALFSLLALLTYHQYRKRKTSLWGLTVLVVVGLALLSKENGIVIPVVLLVYELLLGSRQFGKPPRLVLLGAFVLIFVYLAARRVVMGPLQTGWYTMHMRELALALAVALGHYARLLIYPIHLMATYPKKTFSGLGDAEVLHGLFFLAVFAAFLVLTCNSRKNAFWISILVITLFPALNIIAVSTDLLGERYLYLPSLGFCFLLAEVLLVRLSKAKVGSYLLVLLLFGYFVRDLRRFPEWHDEYTYLTVTLRDAPTAYLYYNNLGKYLHTERKDMKGAITAFEKAVSLAPGFEIAQSNLAKIYLDIGRPEKALYHALRATELKPTWVDPVIMAAEASGRMGDLEQAEKFLMKALELRPNHPHALNNMGNVAFLRGDMQQAVRWWEKAEKIDASNASVLYNLGLAYEKLGDRKRAASYFKRFSQTASPEMSRLKEEAGRKADSLLKEAQRTGTKQK